LTLQREWESQVAPAYDQENECPGAEALVDEEIAFDNFMSERLNRFDSDLEVKKASFLDDLFYAALPGNYAMNQEAKMEPESDSEDTGQPSAKKPRTQQAVRDFKREISETRARIRRLDHPIWTFQTLMFLVNVMTTKRMVLHSQFLFCLLALVVQTLMDGSMRARPVTPRMGRMMVLRMRGMI
jgi:hypothetical protein